jgi:CRP-like cAMP-binding protein
LEILQHLSDKISDSKTDCLNYKVAFNQQRVKANQTVSDLVTLGSGCYFGEKEILNRAGRNCSAICISQEVKVFQISSADFLNDFKSKKIL